jgi:hypothetical protein
MAQQASFQRQRQLYPRYSGLLSGLAVPVDPFLQVASVAEHDTGHIDLIRYARSSWRASPNGGEDWIPSPFPSVPPASAAYWDRMRRMLKTRDGCSTGWRTTPNCGASASDRNSLISKPPRTVWSSPERTIKRQKGRVRGKGRQGERSDQRPLSVVPAAEKVCGNGSALGATGGRRGPSVLGQGGRPVVQVKEGEARRISHRNSTKETSAGMFQCAVSDVRGHVDTSVATWRGLSSRRVEIRQSAFLYREGAPSAAVQRLACLDGGRGGSSGTRAIDQYGKK